MLLGRRASGITPVSAFKWSDFIFPKWTGRQGHTFFVEGAVSADFGPFWGVIFEW